MSFRAKRGTCFSLKSKKKADSSGKHRPRNDKTVALSSTSSPSFVSETSFTMSKAGDGRWAKAIWTPEPILTPERKLWRAVLEQAYEDAELPQYEQGRARVRARRYLRA